MYKTSKKLLTIPIILLIKVSRNITISTAKLSTCQKCDKEQNTCEINKYINNWFHNYAESKAQLSNEL